MAKIITTKTHNSGIALGGIGSGSVELLPDGEFHYWQIANLPRLTKRCHEEKVDDGKDIEPSPVFQNITFPLVLSDVLARVNFTDGKCSIDCVKGSLDGWEITAG